MSSFVVRRADWDDPIGAALRTAQKTEVSARYQVEDSEPGPLPTADDMTSFFVAFDASDVPVGCGGLRQLDAEHGEIKRMYVVPASRGTGAATALLRRLEQDARERGWSRLVLETGDRQPDAMRFYEREGYTSIPAFGYYVDSPLSRCYELTLK